MPKKSPIKIKLAIRKTLKKMPMSIHELAIAMNSSYTATEKYVKELEKLGVVKRAKCLRPDKVYYQIVRQYKELPVPIRGLKSFVEK